MRFLAIDVSLVTVALIMGIVLVTSSCINVPTDAEGCRATSQSDGGFWKCMDYQQRENAQSTMIWNQMYNRQVPNPNAYMPQQQTTNCYSDGGGGVYCR